LKKTRRVVQEQKCVPQIKTGRKFAVRCHARGDGALHVGADSVSVQVGQRVLRNGAEEMWYSIGIYAHEDEHGSLVVRVLVLNPDWDEALQIARVTSRPGDMNCQTALGCNLDHATG